MSSSKAITIPELCNEAYENSKAKGFHDKPATFGDRIALCHSELSEALEMYRTLDMDSFDAIREPLYTSAQSGRLTRSKGEYICSKTNPSELDYVLNKPDGIGHELADVVIRIGDMCALYGIDLNEAIREKMAYNKTRPYRHGGKKL